MEKYLIVGENKEGKQMTATADTLEMAEIIQDAMYDSDIMNARILVGVKDIPRPSKDQIFDYLDDLRESGITNMFGAVPYIMGEFDGITKKEAARLLAEWMNTFSSRKAKSI